MMTTDVTALVGLPHRTYCAYMGFRGLGTKFLTKCKMGREDHKGELKS